MIIETVTSPKWMNESNTLIECQVKFAEFAEILPFGASASDSEAHGVEIFNRCVAQEFGAIAAYTGPSDAQIAADEAAQQVEAAAQRADITAAKSYAKLTALKNMTPAQVQTWVDNNVTNLAEAQDAIKTLAVAVSILARKF